MQERGTSPARSADSAAEPIAYAAVDRPTQARRHRQDVIRYILLIGACLAIAFLILIAWYYIQGNSVAVRHVS